MGLDNVVAWIVGNKKARKKALKTAAKVGKQVLPVVKSIQAGHGIAKLGNAVNNVGDFASKASKVADTVDNFIPQMQVMGESLCDSAKIFGYFNMAATAVGIGGNFVLTYEGINALHLIGAKLDKISISLAAQTALIAQKDFPQYVYSMIQERLSQTADDPVCDHWFFVFHPDNDWYPNFYHLLERRPLGPKFCGYTNQIDTIFIFMLAVRERIEERARKAKRDRRPSRPVRLHLLMPAYQPLLIYEALKIPEKIGDFIIEGRINSNRPFIWLNLPEAQRDYVVDIGNWTPPPVGWWDWAMTKIGLRPPGDEPPELGEPRTLGTRQPSNDAAEDRSDEGGEDGEGDELDERSTSGRETISSDDLPWSDERHRHSATPLHLRRQRNRGRSHRKSRRKEARERSRESESTLANSHHKQRSRRSSQAQRSV